MTTWPAACSKIQNTIFKAPGLEGEVNNGVKKTIVDG
jgi:hypothetical protein